MDLKSEKILIAGAGISGIGAAALLCIDSRDFYKYRKRLYICLKHWEFNIYNIFNTSTSYI